MSSPRRTGRSYPLPPTVFTDQPYWWRLTLSIDQYSSDEFATDHLPHRSFSSARVCRVCRSERSDFSRTGLLMITSPSVGPCLVLFVMLVGLAADNTDGNRLGTLTCR